MRPIRGPLPLAGVLLALAACGDGGNGQSPAAGVGTLAYVVTSCHEAAGEATVQQKLRIVRGDTAAVTAISVGPLGPFPTFGVCAAYGRQRYPLSPQFGAFQRLGVTPDGSGVVFELNDAFALVGRDLLPAAQRGIYYWSTCDPFGLNPNGSQLFAIQPDGTGLQQLTRLEGFVKSADGTVDVETVGWLWVYRP